MMSEPDKHRKLKIQNGLLAWFGVKGRHFPWRETRDPYAVLLAEKLLQQTAARPDVVQAYHSLLAAFPSPAALAKADGTAVRDMIQSLGLHYRSQELITLAREIVLGYKGHVPNDLKALLAIHGVGDYTARAVLCFAFGQDVPIVDTNIARILYRLFELPGPFPANPARKRSLLELAGELLPKGQSREFNLAMLDLGALVCTHSAPECGICPLSSICAFAAAKAEE